MDEKIVKDCISRRQAVYVCLELIHERRKWLSDAGQKEISGIDAAMCAIQDLPSAQPERERGRWIEDDDGWDGVIWRCSECDAVFTLIDGTPKENEYYFCPYCGADMREVDDGSN